MNDKDPKRDIRFDKKDALYFDERCGYDRRKAPSEGYAYVSTVGWICRREHHRRNDDDDKA